MRLGIHNCVGIGEGVVLALCGVILIAKNKLENVMKRTKYIVIACLVVFCFFWQVSWVFLEKDVERHVMGFKAHLEAKGGRFDSFEYSLTGSPFAFRITLSDVDFEGDAQLIHTALEKYGTQFAYDSFFPTNVTFKSSKVALSGAIWSPWSLEGESDDAEVSMTTADGVRACTHLDGLRFQLSDRNLASISYEESVTRYNLDDPLIIKTTEGKIERIGPRSFSYACDESHLALQLSKEGMSIGFDLENLKYISGPSPYEWSFRGDNFRFSLVDALEGQGFLKAEIGNFKVCDSVAHSDDRAYFARSLDVSDFDAHFFDPQLGDYKFECDAFELGSTLSFLKEKLESYQQVDWFGFYDHWKEVALQRVSRGQFTMPELKDLMVAFQAADPELKFNGKLIHLGNDNHFTLNLSLEELFPKGELSVHLSKEFLPFFASLIHAPELITLDAFDGSFGINRGTFFYNGDPLFDFEVPEWESLPVLTKSLCVDILGMPQEDYHKYVR